MGLGYLLEDNSSSRVLARVGAQIGQGTNNIAEYQALLAGIRHALRLGFWDVMILTDSLLVANQIKGSWGVKDKALAKLHREAQLLLKLCRTWSITHNYREANTAADDLSRQLVFEEPTLPALPTDTGTRFPRSLYDWQAAAIRYWWINFHPGSGTLSRIFGLPTAAVEQIGYGNTYRDVTFASHEDYIKAIPQLNYQSPALPPLFQYDVG
jgi:probable phosphoglycerate mutase